jgi:hypothetical protein
MESNMVYLVDDLLSDCESSESSEEESRLDDQSRESSLGDEIDNSFDIDDESSFVSHDVPLASSYAGSVCSVESALPRTDSMASVESVLTSASGFNTSSDSTASTSGDFYSSDEEDDYVVAVNMSPVKPSSKRSSKGTKKFGSRSSSENSLDGGGSCHSIKEILTIDSISEDKPSSNAPALEYKFELNGDLMVPEMNNLLSKIVQSTQDMAVTTTNGKEATTNTISYTKIAYKKASKIDDPLMSKYLSNRRKKTKAKSKTVNVISSILGSTDSLNHIKGSKNKRVVKTRGHIVRKQEAKHLVVLDSKGEDGEFAEFNMPIQDIEADRKPRPRRTKTSDTPSSMDKKNASNDPLLQRYMNMRKGPAVASAGGLMNNCDSLNHVAGAGSRVVKTRTRGLAKVLKR